MSTNREIIKVLAIITTCFLSASGQSAEYSGNPVFKGLFTADPCAIVYNDTLYVFTGHDEQTPEGKSFLMRDWYTFSTTDMVNWTNHGSKLRPGNFSWASGNAFAGHVVEHNGKFWWYVPMTHKTIKVARVLPSVWQLPIIRWDPGKMLSDRHLSQTKRLTRLLLISILVSISTMELRTFTGVPGELAGMLNSRTT